MEVVASLDSGYAVRMGGIVSVDWSLGEPLYDDHLLLGHRDHPDVHHTVRSASVRHHNAAQLQQRRSPRHR